MFSAFKAPKLVRFYKLSLNLLYSGLLRYGNLNTSLMPILFIYNTTWSKSIYVISGSSNF